jgi:hypothetical protein
MHVAGILPETTGRGVGKQLYRLRPGETLFPADFLRKAPEELCRNSVSSRIRIWARTLDAGTNGGSDLICRFFAGLSPFTIGGLLI